MGVSVGGVVGVTTIGVGVTESGVAEGMGVSIVAGIAGEGEQAERVKSRKKVESRIFDLIGLFIFAIFTDPK